MPNNNSTSNKPKPTKPNPFDKLKNVARPGATANAGVDVIGGTVGMSKRVGAEEDNRTSQLSTGMSSRKLPGALILPIETVAPSPYQIRSNYDEEGLQELADDIAERGILEPILVREMIPGQYEIIAGERRWRAAQIAGLTELPAIVKDLNDEEAVLTMLIENIQRQDLSPQDEQRFFRTLNKKYNYTYRDIAKLIHKSPMYVSRRMNDQLDSLSQVHRENITAIQPHQISDENVARDETLQEAIEQSSKSRGSNEQRNNASKFSVIRFKKVSTELEATLAYLREQAIQGARKPRNHQKNKNIIQQELVELKRKLAEIEAQFDSE